MNLILRYDKRRFDGDFEKTALEMIERHIVAMEQQRKIDYAVRKMPRIVYFTDNERENIVQELKQFKQTATEPDCLYFSKVSDPNNFEPSGGMIKCRTGAFQKQRRLIATTFSSIARAISSFARFAWCIITER